MVKKGNPIDRVLMVMLNLLLAGLISIITFGGKEIIANQKETVKAVQDLRVVLTSHGEKIENLEENDKKQDEEIDELDKRVDGLETFYF